MLVGDMEGGEHPFAAPSTSVRDAQRAPRAKSRTVFALLIMNGPYLPLIDRLDAALQLPQTRRSSRTQH